MSASLSASSPPPPTMMTATATTSSSTAAAPAAFPIKLGRGGAGNIYNEAELQPTPAARGVDDVEAQRSVNDDRVADEEDARERINNPNRPPPDYAHSGRGGAGNWFSPREEIQKLGHEQEMKPMEKDRPGKPSSPSSSSASSSSSSAPTTSVRPAMKFHPGGRGGAGNIEFGRQIVEQRRREAERAASEIQGKKDVEINQQVVVDVEAGLTPPPKARLGTDRLATEQG